VSLDSLSDLIVKLALAPDMEVRRSLGVSRDELIELITHLAFYAGWPTASSATST
jgi:alkylhydroperoxidase/carboxymuconolactone decarboxylase family protein YurZ